MDAYSIIRDAILNKYQITANYQGHYREMCPHVIGRGPNGDQQALFYQFGGTSSRGLPPLGAWRCCRIAELAVIQARAGDWHTGPRHTRPQTCVSEIDAEVEF